MAYKVLGDLVVSSTNLPDASTGAKGIVQLAGDLAGTSTSPSVAKANGATIPAAGSLTTAHVLKVSGTAALTYGFILNANVDASAAIAGSKISPDFGAQNVVTSGIVEAPTHRVGTGGSAPTVTSGTGSPVTTPADGSLFMRTDGSDASNALYTRQGGSWFALTGGGGSFTAGGDLTGSSSSQQVISLTGSGGTLSVATTGAIFQWVTGASTPTIKQADNTSGSATGQTLTVQAQNATGTTSTGGNLTLTSGTGTSVAGNLILSTGGTAKFTITPTLYSLVNATLQFTTGTSSPTVNQADNTTNSATAQNLTVQAQNATGTSATGGNLILTSGTGTSTNGTVNIVTPAATVAKGTGSKFSVEAGFRRSITGITANHSVAAGNYLISVGTLSAGITVTLPASPSTGDSYIVKDTNGSAASFNIIIDGNGNNIDSAATYTISTNYAAVELVFTGTIWSVL